ncbi:hypothetical protein MSG28_004854 [Choristoneura fumiferana]|uniref:Uncharacterized protein n=1 Tax=Choristoneura fumiferana TaxID=7141 RepID=A0ACC0K8J7_CHOFU|nr:hypothetical protein MSG28_004854 [Choristoneura fumiferana]
MSQRLNKYGQHIGPELPGWTPRPWPARITFTGEYCRLEPVNAAVHGAKLYQAYALDDGRLWTYMFDGTFRSQDDFMEYVRRIEVSGDAVHFVVIDKKNNQPLGTMALMRIDTKNGVIEIGCIAFSSLLQRTRMSTECHYLLMMYVFETLGYRRYEWKNDSLNAASRRAALRLGFQFEGTFRQAVIYKGRSRDTNWFSLLDSEWPRNKAAMQAWLAADNFDTEGHNENDAWLMLESK